MGEIPLAIDKAALLAALLLVKGHLLPFNTGECVFMGTEAGDVCDDAGVLELDKCVVDNEVGEVVGMEDVEVCVSSGHGSEGWFGECAGVEGFEVLDLVLAAGAKVVGVVKFLELKVRHAQVVWRRTCP